jgi:hypothetical protein
MTVPQATQADGNLRQWWNLLVAALLWPTGGACTSDSDHSAVFTTARQRRRALTELGEERDGRIPPPIHRILRGCC